MTELYSSWDYKEGGESVVAKPGLRDQQNPETQGGQAEVAMYKPPNAKGF